jgi:hypothetical protein
MPAATPPSRCSCRSEVEFIWFGEPPQGTYSAVQAATLAFSTIMKPAGRLWNPYSWAITKAEFKKRLEIAMAGQLVPVAEVKDISRGAEAHLYEIRWTFTVLEHRADGVKINREIEVRQYHAEPAELPFAFVGLHVHEKNTDPDQDIRALQNVEIDHAVALYEGGRGLRWGV